MDLDQNWKALLALSRLMTLYKSSITQTGQFHPLVDLSKMLVGFVLVNLLKWRTNIISSTEICLTQN